MVLLPGEQHGVGGGLRSLAAVLVYQAAAFISDSGLYQIIFV